jgi:hypothetical protein
MTHGSDTRFSDEDSLGAQILRLRLRMTKLEIPGNHGGQDGVGDYLQVD